MKRRYHLVILSIIFILGAILRFYQLGDVPSSLNWDEVSWGYNAYSISQTGQDEHGRAYPLSFEAFGDYKQPVYVYLQTIPVKIFGLSAFSVRFPSAIFGTLTILFVYLLTKELFHRYKYITQLSLLASVFFALSPWSIQFSRVAFEANVATFFIISGAWLFLKGINEKKFTYMLSAVLIISISSFTYHSAKIFTPLLLASLFVLNYKYFLSIKKQAIVLAIIYLLFNSLWIADMRTTSRGRSVVFTSHQTEILQQTIPYLDSDVDATLPLNHIIHNRRIVYASYYLQNYLAHFDPNFLFIEGDNPRHHAPGMGVLYLSLLPFIIIGIVKAVEMRGKNKWILFAWLFLAPAASALAVDAPNASRSLVFLPTWQIFAAIGTISVSRLLKKRKVILALLAIAFLSNVIYYLDNYYLLTNDEQARSWQHGYKEAIDFAAASTQPVYFRDSVEQAYIFYLYHTKYPPQRYLDIGGSSIREDDCYSIENAYFGDCDLDGKHYIVADAGEDIEAEYHKSIYLPDGEEILKIYEK